MKRTPLKRGSSQLKRTRMKRSRPDPERGVEFSDDVRAQARVRGGNRCEGRCTKSCTVRIQTFHHRLRRTQGGKGTLENCLALCRACHDHIHAHPSESFIRGWLIRGTGLPAR
jgi:5-methylcytosine-specific restriction endonuclease McrA